MNTPETSLPAGATARRGGDNNAGRAGTRRGGPLAQPEPCTWTIEFPAKQELLNANDRRHPKAKARIVKQLRRDAFLLARHAKVPHIERAQIDCVYEPPDRRTRDAANWSDTAKALVDGVVDAGVLADDDHTRLAGPFMHIGDRFPGGRMVLIITELTAPETTNHA